MRFLIVNGYSYNDRMKFEIFKDHIMKFISGQNELVDTESEYYIRDRDSIEDFLYE